MEQSHKITGIEAFFLISMALIIDIIGIILIFFLLDDLFILDTFGITTQLYFRMRGVNGAGYDLAYSIGEFIPYVGALPLKTVGILTVLWIDRHPEGSLAKAASTIPTPKKSGPAVKTPRRAPAPVTNFQTARTQLANSSGMFRKAA